MTIIYLSAITMAYRKMVGVEKNYGIISLLNYLRLVFKK